MAKPIKVMIEVERIAFGDVFVSLDGMRGVVSITPIGDGPRNARLNGGGTRGQKHGGAQSASCLVLGALLQTPGLSRAQLIEVLTGNGKAATTLPDTLAKLRNAGEIRSSGKGKDVTYKATPSGRKRYETACTIQPLGE